MKIPPASNRSPETSPVPKNVHKLDLYRLAVQQPWAQVNWLVNAYAYHNPGKWATHLREDFSGSSALAMAWVNHDYDHTAQAVDCHKPTIAFATRRAKAMARKNELDLSRLSILTGDVLDPTFTASLTPADILVAMNFSINIIHDQPSLVAYFKDVRKSLSKQGLLAFDLYGGPGAWRVSTQHRKIRPAREEKIPPFDYYWQQKDADPLTGMVHNAIDFKQKARPRQNNAFVYHWRLWTLPELHDALAQAGFKQPVVWCHDEQADSTDTQGLEPVDRIGPREDFVAYITASKND